MIKTEHAGPKNSGRKSGFWGHRRDAKETCRVLRRAADKEAIDDAVGAWHESDSPLELHEYLGWTWEEYARWLKTNEPPDRPLPLPPAHTRGMLDGEAMEGGASGEGEGGPCGESVDQRVRLHRQRTATRRGKDTKRWCLGRRGREHRTAVYNYYELKGWRHEKPLPEWLVLTCTRCGKQLDSWWAPREGWSFMNKPRPEWAK